GSPSTWAYCQPLVPLFSSLVKEKHLSILVVGAGPNPSAAAGFTFRAWEEAAEIKDLQQMDIGIMPIPDEPWARGKCGYKLIQYMACGLPVIAAPVGVNSTIVEHGVNGFLASGEAEWRGAITTLMENPDMRRRMGQAGREKVKQAYSAQL